MLNYIKNNKKVASYMKDNKFVNKKVDDFVDTFAELLVALGLVVLLFLIFGIL